MDIKTYDIVLGLHWLKKVVHQASWNYDKLAMTFWYDGEMCTAQPEDNGECHFISRPMRCREDVCQFFLLQTVSAEAGHRCVLIGEPKMKVEGIRGLLAEFADVFAEPNGLPPLRKNSNHPIVLMEGSDPVNLRPYRYSTIQKDELEKQVKGLLESGVIQNSSSSFASPIVLVKKKDGSWRLCID